MPASSVTIPEVTERLNGQGEDVRHLLETADEVSYSARRLSQPELVEWRTLVHVQLERFAKA